MVSPYVRVWVGAEWQNYALRLVQHRYGASNVQRVPDKVCGDCGIEFFTTCGTLFQCYAPEDPSSTAKAASSMKAKATTDLGKLLTYKDEITALMAGIKAKRWFLLCPFLDNKAVVAHVRRKGSEMLSKGLIFIDPSFQALVHSQEDFADEIEALRRQMVGPPIVVPDTDPHVVNMHAASAASTVMLEKLKRAFPNLKEKALNEKNLQFINRLVRHENTMNSLKYQHPMLWEQVYETVVSEENRLIILGASGNAPREQLEESLKRIDESLRNDLPTLKHSMRQDLSQGVLSDWLMRCPLDFS